MAYSIIFLATVVVVTMPLLFFMWYDSFQTRRLYDRLALQGDFQAASDKSNQVALELFKQAYQAIIKANFGCDNDEFECKLGYALKRTAKDMYLLDLSTRYQNPLYPDHHPSFTPISTLIFPMPLSIHALLLVRAKMGEFVESVFQRSGALKYDNFPKLGPQFRQKFQIAVFGEEKAETIEAMARIFLSLAIKFPFARNPKIQKPYGEAYAYLCPEGWAIVCSRITRMQQVKRLLESGEMLAQELARQC